MSGETLRAPRQQLRLLRASGLPFPAQNPKSYEIFERRTGSQGLAARAGGSPPLNEDERDKMSALPANTTVTVTIG